MSVRAADKRLTRQRLLTPASLRGYFYANRAHFLLMPAYLWLGIFFLLPLSIVVFYSVTERGALGQMSTTLTFEHYARLWDPLYTTIIARSFGLAALTTVVCVVLGYPFAFALARSPQRIRTTLLMLLMIPFWTNFLIRTFAWVVILRTNGLINASLASLGLIDAPLSMLFTPGAVLLGLVYGFFPFMVLPMYAAIERLDDSYLEASADLGARPWQTLWRVIVPLSAPGIAAGILLVFIPALGMFAIPDLMGGAKVSLIGNVIQNQFTGARNWQFGSALSVVLMALVVAGLALYRRFFRMEGIL